MMDRFLKKHSGYVLNKYSFVIFPLVWLTMICQPVLGQTGDTILAWGKGENSVYNIYFSRRTQKKWSAPKQLSFSNHLEILPTLTSNTRGDIWVAWTEIKTTGGKIKYCQYQNGEWGLPKSIKTISTFNTAPSAIVDDNGDPWLVWSGTDQADDDIFFSRWKNGDWIQPAKVNTDDQWPDILPQLELESTGMPKVSWRGYDGTKYVTFSSSWTGMAWGPEQVSREPVGPLTESMATPTGTDRAALISDLPDFVTDVDQATIHFYQQGKAYTIRLRGK